MVAHPNPPFCRSGPNGSCFRPECDCWIENTRSTTSSQQPTPRTDALEHRYDTGNMLRSDFWDLSRQLERELAEMDAQHMAEVNELSDKLEAALSAPSASGGSVEEMGKIAFACSNPMGVSEWADLWADSEFRVFCERLVLLAQSARSGAGAVSGWISVNDRLPDDDHFEWLVMLENGAIVSEYYHHFEGWATDENVTHWMPLPQRPVKKGNK